jgi:hypothetical protein
MMAKATMSFFYEPLKVYKRKGEVFEISDPRVFLDLAQARFVEQVDRTSEREDNYR